MCSQEPHPYFFVANEKVDVDSQSELLVGWLVGKLYIVPSNSEAGKHDKGMFNFLIYCSIHNHEIES